MQQNVVTGVSRVALCMLRICRAVEHMDLHRMWFGWAPLCVYTVYPLQYTTFSGQCDGQAEAQVGSSQSMCGPRAARARMVSRVCTLCTLCNTPLSRQCDRQAEAQVGSSQSMCGLVLRVHAWCRACARSRHVGGLCAAGAARARQNHPRHLLERSRCTYNK